MIYSHRYMRLPIFFVGILSFFPHIINCAEYTEKVSREKTKKNFLLKATKKISKSTAFATMGIVAAANCAILTFSLLVLLQNIQEVQSSHLSNTTMKLLIYLFRNFSSHPRIQKYILSGIIFTLSSCILCSFYVMYNMFQKTYNTINTITITPHQT